MERQKQIFREKSMKKVGSPEALDDYIRVPGPRAWLFLAVIGLLFGGFFVWSLFGNLYTTVPAVAVSGKDGVVCYIREEDAASLRPGMVLEVGRWELSLEEISQRPVPCGELDPYVCHVGGYAPDDWVYQVRAGAGEAEDGVYAAQVTTERVSPISFLWN